MKVPEEIVAAIQKAERVALFTHIHPDGDALGSLLGFAGILRLLGKDVFCFLEEEIPAIFDFLPGRESISISEEELTTFCENGENLLGVALDCGDSRRLGYYRNTILTIPSFLVIDHHLTHQAFGDKRWVEPFSSSTGEMVYELAKALDVEITEEIASLLYVAISTDTGSFQYECTTSNTMRIGADLLDKGVEPAKVFNNIHNIFTYERIHLMEMVLAGLTPYGDGSIAVIRVTREMLVKSGASKDDIEGFVDIPRSIKKVKVVVFIKEGERGVTSVSLRAKGYCDVSKVAVVFDGGGHSNAAGCRFVGKTIAEIEALVTGELMRQMGLVG